jgi:hypothetical protein
MDNDRQFPCRFEYISRSRCVESLIDSHVSCVSILGVDSVAYDVHATFIAVLALPIGLSVRST